MGAYKTKKKLLGISKIILTPGYRKSEMVTHGLIGTLFLFPF